MYKVTIAMKTVLLYVVICGQAEYVFNIYRDIGQRMRSEKFDFCVSRHILRTNFHELVYLLVHINSNSILNQRFINGTGCSVRNQK